MVFGVTTLTEYASDFSYINDSFTPFLTATSSPQAYALSYSSNLLSFANKISVQSAISSPHHQTVFLTNFNSGCLKEMKFGKRLKQQIQETLPAWRDKFLSYKDLKKLVRLISSYPLRLPDQSPEHGKAEAEFVYLLNSEIEKFNAFFMEQEEDFIIRHKELQQRIKRAVETWGPNGTMPSESEYKDEMAKIRKDIIDFHGEMVLLENYSNINYTGLAKILKKYDKRTGGSLRLPFIQKALQQPFFTTDLVSKLVKECENTIDEVFPAEEEENTKEKRREAITVVGKGIFRNTVAALLTMQEIRRGSSTYGQFSLPPLNLPDSESDLIHSFQLGSFSYSLMTKTES